MHHYTESFMLDMSPKLIVEVGQLEGFVTVLRIGTLGLRLHIISTNLRCAGRDDLTSNQVAAPSSHDISKVVYLFDHRVIAKQDKVGN